MASPGVLSVPVRIGVVAGGYALAFLAALAAVLLNELLFGANWQASSGMAAFGDGLLFGALFGVASIIPTCAAFYFLRHSPLFWKALGGLAVMLALTALAALAAFLGFEPLASSWSAGCVLRLLAAPLFCGLFFLGGLFSPLPRARWTLLGCAAVEGASFGLMIALLFLGSYV